MFIIVLDYLGATRTERGFLEFHYSELSISLNFRKIKKNRKLKKKSENLKMPKMSQKLQPCPI